MSSEGSCEQVVIGQTLFLPKLEQWIENVLSSNKDMSESEITKFVTEGFHRSMRANAEYHDSMAKFLSDDKAIPGTAAFHRVMASIYGSMCKEG